MKRERRRKYGDWQKSFVRRHDHAAAEAAGGEGYVRLSYATSLDNIKEALNRLQKYLD